MFSSEEERRKVPIPAILRDYLVKQRMRSGRRGHALIFGNTPETPFTANMLQRRAEQAWKKAGLERITPHACRHTFASLMIAAGVNAKALATTWATRTSAITLDRYDDQGSRAHLAGGRRRMERTRTRRGGRDPGEASVSWAGS